MLTSARTSKARVKQVMVVSSVWHGVHPGYYLGLGSVSAREHWSWFEFNKYSRCLFALRWKICGGPRLGPGWERMLSTGMFLWSCQKGLAAPGTLECNFWHVVTTCAKKSPKTKVHFNKSCTRYDWVAWCVRMRWFDYLGMAFLLLRWPLWPHNLDSWTLRI